jgi:hypothetical protein
LQRLLQITILAQTTGTETVLGTISTAQNCTGLKTTFLTGLDVPVLLFIGHTVAAILSILQQISTGSCKTFQESFQPL